MPVQLPVGQCANSGGSNQKLTPSLCCSQQRAKSAGSALDRVAQPAGPAPQVMYAVCSGSEANDLALRIAMANAGPGATHVAVMDGAYHGHTTATIQLSPYKFDGPGGEGRPAHVHVLPLPDEMR